MFLAAGGIFPGSGIEPVSPLLADRLSATDHEGSPPIDFDKGARQFNVKGKSPQQIHVWEIDSFLTLYVTVNSTWVTDLNMREID